MPRGAADAGVLAPIPGSPLGVALAVAGNPRYGRIDARARRASWRCSKRCAASSRSVRGRSALTDCLELRQPAQARTLRRTRSPRSTGLAPRRASLGSPFVSGNVSLYNESKSGGADSAVGDRRVRRRVAGRRARRDTPGLKRAGFGAAVDRQPRTGGRRLGPGRRARHRRSAAGDFLRLRTQRDRDRRRPRFRPASCSRAAPISRRRHADGARAARVRRARRGTRSSAPSAISAIRCAKPAVSSAKSATTARVDVSGMLKVGVHDRRPRLVVNGTSFRRRRAVRNLVDAAGGDVSVSARIAVLVFPGTNSEDETLRLLRDCGGDAELVHWSRARALAGVRCVRATGRLRVRRSHSRGRDCRARSHDGRRHRRRGQPANSSSASATARKFCWKPGSVPGTGAVRRPTAAFTATVRCRISSAAHVYVKLAIEPSRCAITAALPQRRADSGVRGARRGTPGGERRSTCERSSPAIISRSSTRTPTARVDARAVPNGSALGAAGLVNREGNVLAIMPHPERDALELQSSRPARRRRHAGAVGRRGAVSRVSWKR